MDMEDIKSIKADAEKAVQRQFRDATEDDGWTPTSWEPDASMQELEATVKEDGKKK